MYGTARARRMTQWIRSNENRLICQADSEEETRAIAAQIANQLAAGDVLALIGDLGAGKTQFSKAVAATWGVPADEVNSPTFTLIQEYAGRIPIRHCDTYRLRQVEEFADLGLEELFAPDGITLVEWADRVVEYLPRDRLEVRFSIVSPTGRQIELSATGKRSRQILAELA